MTSRKVTSALTVLSLALSVFYNKFTDTTAPTGSVSVPIVNAAGDGISSIFSDSRRLPMRELVSLLVERSSSDRGCNGSASFRYKVARAWRSVLTSFTVHAFSCSTTMCGGGIPGSRYPGMLSGWRRDGCGDVGNGRRHTD